MPRKPSRPTRRWTAPAVLEAIRCLPGPERVSLFAALAEQPERAAPFVVLAADEYNGLLTDILSAQMARSRRPRRATEREKHVTMYNLYIADPRKNNQRALARRFDMEYDAVRQAISRERRRRAAAATADRDGQTGGVITAAWET